MHPILEMDQFKKTGLEFVLTEIRVGLTFATLALQADAWDYEKIEREVTNARKAYEAAVKFQRKIGFTDEETEKIEQNMKALRAALEKIDQQRQSRRSQISNPQTSNTEKDRGNKT